MKKLKTYFIAFLITFTLQTKSFSQDVPGSFADLAEKLMPSVVNISTTMTVTTQSNPFPFQFPPAHTHPAHSAHASPHMPHSTCGPWPSGSCCRAGSGQDPGR